MSGPAYPARHFGLSLMALRFARFYAERPLDGITDAARRAGYSDKGKGAHVRACELMRDPRVIRAVMHFGVLAFSEAQGRASKRLDILAEGDPWLEDRDRWQLLRLRDDLAAMTRAAAAVDRACEAVA